MYASAKTMTPMGILLWTAGGTLLAAGVIALLRQPRPQAVLRRLFPTARRLLGVGEFTVGETGETQQETDLEKFRNAAGAVWNTLKAKFERYGYFGQGSTRDGLERAVAIARWPDAPELDDMAVMMTSGAITDFCGAVCIGAGVEVFGEDTASFLAFDNSRRDLSTVLSNWSDQLTDPGFIDWLRHVLVWPDEWHRRTLKLCWYLEIAAATENENPNFAFLPAVRDALDGPTRYSRP